MTSRALRIVIVEDQLLIAKQLEMVAVSAGHQVVGTATAADQAFALVRSTHPDLVFVDISLAKDSSGLDVAKFAAEHEGVHVIFTTANRRRLPEDYCGAFGVLEKPFTRAGLLAAINFVAACIWAPSKTPAKPDSLQLSPLYSARRH